MEETKQLLCQTMFDKKFNACNQINLIIELKRVFLEYFVNGFMNGQLDKVFVKELIGINNGLPRGRGVETSEFVIVEELREHNGNDDELEKGEKEVDNGRGGGDNTTDG
ncbi:hypothetical protein Smp_173750 [Schistosoma mansoni]|uniref:hypothetical protein n=1 Tax=Schistosoma mansoni TaxID=6183 RepID=UPI00022DC9A1|nr:hypothetical protein Smp_173750 [Schistosoma mansoni]|eukprot:XP_018655228.1 hypothetical protein Smp_173750 [Schistosoma mansoni]